MSLEVIKKPVAFWGFQEREVAWYYKLHLAKIAKSRNPMNDQGKLSWNLSFPFYPLRFTTNFFIIRCRSKIFLLQDGDI